MNQNNPDNIFNSLEGLQKAEMPPFFYTRLRARMENELLKEKKTVFVLRPGFLSACLLVVLVVNVIALQQNRSHHKKASHQPASIENFADYYNLNTESVYE